MLTIIIANTILLLVHIQSTLKITKVQEKSYKIVKIIIIKIQELKQIMICMPKNPETKKEIAARSFTLKDKSINLIKETGKKPNQQFRQISKTGDKQHDLYRKSFINIGRIYGNGKGGT